MNRIVLPCLLLLSSAAFAQSVNWSPASGQIEEGVTTRLNLVFTDCDADTINLPEVSGLEFGTPSMSSRMQIINFRTSRTKIYSYPVRAKGVNEVVIPEFEVKTDEGPLMVPPARFRVVAATLGGSATPSPVRSGPSAVQRNVEDVVQVIVDTGKTNAWAGEVLESSVVVQGLSQFFRGPRALPDWNPSGVVTSDWQQHDEQRGRYQGQEVTRFVFPREIAVPEEPGTLKLSPATVPVVLRENIQNRVVEIESDPVELTVQPLPQTDMNFSGAVGDFEFSSKLVPTEVVVGEPITWTIEVSGKGNWPAGFQLPDRQVPQGFEVIQPRSKTDMADDSPFRGTLSEDVVLIPEKTGTFQIPAVRFVSFDPNTGEYRIQESDPVTLTVKPAQATTPPDPVGTGRAVAPGREPIPTMDMVPQIPRDPLDKKASAPAPMGRLGWWSLMILPLVGVGLFWMTCLLHRIQGMDARADARKALQTLKRDPDFFADHGKAGVREWRRLVVTYWGLRHRVPAEWLLRQRIREREGEQVADTWAALWRDTDLALFKNETGLPGDWGERNVRAIRCLKKPGLEWKTIFNPRVWVPSVLAGFYLGGALHLGALEEAPPEAEVSYRAGEFPKAEAALRLRLEEVPRDWAARNDLALALFQQERFDQAAAHIAIARLLVPSQKTVSWNSRILLEEAGWQNTRVGRFLLSSSWGDAWARLLSVAGWQWMVVAGVWLISGSLALLLTWVYLQPKPEGVRVVAWILVIPGLMILGALWALDRYGPMKDPDLVLVEEAFVGRSIPTEVDQQTRRVPPGTVGRTTAEFLGWKKMELPNRETVWVREEEVVSVYR